MNKIIKFIFLLYLQIFRKATGIDVKKKNKIYTLGERNENGYCDLYLNGIKKNVQLLVFDKNQIGKFESIDLIKTDNNKNE
jgi:hypothetical protein